jgi:hypothetical protein
VASRARTRKTRPHRAREASSALSHLLQGVLDYPLNSLTGLTGDDLAQLGTASSLPRQRNGTQASRAESGLRSRCSGPRALSGHWTRHRVGLAALAYGLQDWLRDRLAIAAVEAQHCLVHGGNDTVEVGHVTGELQGRTAAQPRPLKEAHQDAFWLLPVPSPQLSSPFLVRT